MTKWYQVVALFWLILTLSHHMLHSFPTRRSSDLPGAVRLADHDAHLGHGGLADRADHLGAVADDALALDQRGHRDRKSTRLNSSHVEISYAVFCLKKKNYTRSYYIDTEVQFNIAS